MARVECSKCGKSSTKPTTVGEHTLCRKCVSVLTKSCQVCGNVHMAEDVHEVTLDGEHVVVCNDCITGYKKCTCCNSYTMEHTTVSEDVLCNKCFQESYAPCTYCGEVVGRDTMNSEGECTTCSAMPRCRDCGTRVDVDDSTLYMGERLCLDCYSRSYQYCEDCGETFRESEIRYYGNVGQWRCDSCKPTASVVSYSHKPTPVFYGSACRNDMFLGVELEIDNGNSQRRALQGLDDVFGESAYYKQDGSLNEGFEIVTHPMTLNYHMTEVDWEKALESAVAAGYRSHNTSTCGLHVHVNRTYFGSEQDEQDLGIMKVLYFFEKFWHQVVKFSRRKSGELGRWAARYTMKQTMEHLLHSAKCSGRYHAVNLQCSNTVEFRVFKGTLKYNTFIATLQFVHEVCRITDELSPEELHSLTWQGFLDKVEGCTELKTYIDERRLSTATHEITFGNDSYIPGDSSDDDDDDYESDDYDDDDEY